MIKRAELKQILGDLPLTAELYWLLQQSGKPLSESFSLQRIDDVLPVWCSQAQEYRLHSHRSTNLLNRRIFIFSTLRYWIEHAALLAVTLAGMGHYVTFVYIPYANWRKPISLFDFRRQNLYARSVFRKAEAILKPISLLTSRNLIPTVKKTNGLPEALLNAVNKVSLRDTQYTLQLEEFDESDPQSEAASLFQLRKERNFSAAIALFDWLKRLTPDKQPDVLLTPNGSILEMGAVFQVARFLRIPTVTYEFGEQRQRIWLAKDSEVMQQNTEALWGFYKEFEFTDAKFGRIKTLYTSRKKADLWSNFSRRWQEQPGIGGKQVRETLQLDERPVALLAANVIGDSLTLDRQIFSLNMTEWLKRTVDYFACNPEIQLLIRVHPGERFTQGPSVSGLVRSTLPEIPEHIRLIEHDSPINTYDLIEISDFGLVYTTTVGMEMAMGGVPVIVAGQTHYRNKGFTLDPETWDQYFRFLDEISVHPKNFHLNEEQVQFAWNYAYIFFFDYPLPFPWHLRFFWDELEEWPIERVLSEVGQANFGETFESLLGKTRTQETPSRVYLDGINEPFELQKHSLG